MCVRTCVLVAAAISLEFMSGQHTESRTKKDEKSVWEQGNMLKMLDKLALWRLLALAPKYRAQLKNGKDHKANVQCFSDAGKKQTWWHLWLLIKQDAVSLGAVMLAEI